MGGAIGKVHDRGTSGVSGDLNLSFCKRGLGGNTCAAASPAATTYLFGIRQIVFMPVPSETFAGCGNNKVMFSAYLYAFEGAYKGQDEIKTRHNLPRRVVRTVASVFVKAREDG